MILVTGATGFVGSALVRQLLINEVSAAVKVAVRSTDISWPKSVHPIQVANLTPKTDWTAALRNVDQVVHLAARVHVMIDKSADPLAEFRLVNVEATMNLARQAAAAGVRRFV